MPVHPQMIRHLYEAKTTLYNAKQLSDKDPDKSRLIAAATKEINAIESIIEQIEEEDRNPTEEEW